MADATNQAMDNPLSTHKQDTAGQNLDGGGDAGKHHASTLESLKHDAAARAHDLRMELKSMALEREARVADAFNGFWMTAAEELEVLEANHGASLPCGTLLCLSGTLSSHACCALVQGWECLAAVTGGMCGHARPGKLAA
jgi:hypothetical protein